MKLSIFSACTLIILVTAFLALGSGCSRNSSELQTTKAVGAAVQNLNTLESLNLIQKNAANPNFIILDVRTPDEFKSGHIASAINIDVSAPDFQAQVGKLDRAKEYLVYCRIGIRSAQASSIMIDAGFKHVDNLLLGINQWVSSGYAIAQ